MLAIFYLQFPINVDHTAGFGFSAYMADLDSLDYIVQDFRCQFLYVSIIAKMRVNFSALLGQNWQPWESIFD